MGWSLGKVLTKETSCS